MSVQEISRAHQRYVELSNRFKATWTFHQFIQGIQKAYFPDEPITVPAHFPDLFSRLKAASKQMTGSGIGGVEKTLAGLETELSRVEASLLVVDEQVTPGQMRRFFQRVKNYDDGILSQLVKFYVYPHAVDWTPDRLDKVDFLVTKLCEHHDERADRFTISDRTQLREIAEGIWRSIGEPEVEEQTVVDGCAALDKRRRRFASIASIDQLNDTSLIREHRHFKHALGTFCFEPRLLQSIVEANLVLKNLIHKLYQREEQRIVAEYQEVFDLEREVPIDVRVASELNDFHQAVERFEDHLQGSDLRLAELAQLRDKTRHLVGKLKPDPEGAGIQEVPPPEVRAMREDDPLAEAPTPPSRPELEHLDEQHRAIIGALEDSNSGVDARKVILQPGIFALRLEAREVIAYRRLYGDGTCDRRLEQFLLRAAALRLRTEEEVEEIRSLLDDSSVTREGPVYASARQTARLGDLFLSRFAHLLEQAVLRSDAMDAKNLLLLKMRLMRSYSGLWLLLYRPQ